MHIRSQVFPYSLRITRYIMSMNKVNPHWNLEDCQENIVHELILFLKEKNIIWYTGKKTSTENISHPYTYTVAIVFCLYPIACRRYIPCYESYPISLTSWTLWPMIWYFMHSQGCTTWRKERTGLAIGVFGACWRYELSGHRPIPWTVCKHAQILHRYL